MNRMTGRTMLFLAALLLAGFAAPRPASAIFEDVYTYEGVLGSITDIQITVVNEANVVVPIVVPKELKLTPDYIVGQRVWVELEKIPYSMYRLRAIRHLGDAPVLQPSEP